MDAPLNQGEEGSRVHSPPREENLDERNLHPEDEAVLKQIIGQALEDFNPMIFSRVDQIVTTRLTEFKKKHPILTNPQQQLEIQTAQQTTNKETIEV